MFVMMLGFSQAKAPVEVRERVAFAGQTLADGLRRLTTAPAILEGVILSTCNRVEVYALVTDLASGREALAEFYQTATGTDAADLARYATLYTGSDAARHLMCVAAGLDSQIIGEAQIIGQVKNAWAEAQRAQSSGVILDALFRSALMAGKRARTETEIGRGAVSVTTAAVELAKEVLGGLEGRSVLILGSGKMGELTARQLSACGIERTYVASRSLEAANKLSRQTGGECVPFQSLLETLTKVDLVFCCTGAPHHVLTAADLAAHAAGRNGRELLIVDVSVPRNIDPAIAALPHMAVRDIDDLHAIARRHRVAREALVTEVERLIEEELASFVTWVKNYRVAPTIVSLRGKVDQLRQTELERFWQKNNEKFSPEQQQLISDMTQALINKVLHDPLSQLKAMSSQQQRQHAVALESLFDLTVKDFKTHYRQSQDKRRTPRGAVR